MASDEKNRRVNGFIKLSRRLTDWEWYDDPNVLTVWIHCLLSANWKDNRYHGTVIPRGSFITSYARFAQECGLAVTTVRRCFEKLQSTGEISLHVTRRGTYIKVLNYAVFQDSGTTGWHTDDIAVDTTTATTADTLLNNSKNIRKERIKKNTKKKNFFPGKGKEELPEYYTANPIRDPNPIPATPEEIAAVREQLKKGKPKQ